MLSLYLRHRLTIISDDRGNNDELVQRLEDTANRFLVVERTVVSGVPKAAEEAMEKLKSYVVFRAPKGYHKEHVTIQEFWERNEGIKC